MKKKICLSVLCLIVLIGVSGCGSKSANSSSTNETTNTNESSNNIEKEMTYVNTLNGTLDGNVILSNPYYLVTDTEGKLMEYNVNQLFSNDTNYKIKKYDNKEFNNVNGLTSDKDFYQNDCRIAISPGDSISFTSGDCNKPSKYKLIFSHVNINIYITQDNQMLAEENFNSKEINNVNTDILSNEKIIGLYFKGYDSWYLKTDKNYYVVDVKEEITNKEQCEKYSDVNCEHKHIINISKEDTLSKLYTDINFIATSVNREHFIVFKDNNVYKLNY